MRKIIIFKCMQYTDLVIQDGKFEKMCSNSDDFWNLLKKNKLCQNLNYKIIINYCNYLRNKKKFPTLEIGCGFPHIFNKLFKNTFNVFGTDIFDAVIKKSIKNYPKLKNKSFLGDFLNLNVESILLNSKKLYQNKFILK
jgi:hypothetical protein